MPWRPPEPLIERARQIAAGTLEPAPVSDAATVVLVRDGTAGLEVHLQRRVATMAFAAGMHVFPGGRVDPADYAISVALPEAWVGLLGGGASVAAAVTVAACRETFEEAGVLLADHPGDLNLAAARGRPFAELGIEPNVSMLRPWARWVTPEFEPRRYDTRFFAAVLPDGQAIAGDDAGGEADSAIWVEPAAALAAHRSGEFGMLPPTVFTLSELSEYAAAADVFAAAELRDCKVVLPKLLVDGDDIEFVLGSDAGDVTGAVTGDPVS